MTAAWRAHVPVSPPAPRAAARPQPSATRRPPRPLGRDLAATLALTAYSAAVAAGFARVFSGWGFLADLSLLVVVPHAVSFGLRRARLSGWLASPIVAVVALWLMLAMRYGHTFTGPFPGRGTWQLLDLELDLVRAQFPTAVAPVIYEVGWAAMAAFAVVLVAVLGDTFAFRAHARGEALVPGLVLFVFVAALGDDRLRVTLTALLIGTGVIAVVALRHYHDPTARVARGGDGRRSASMVVPAAAATAVAIAGIAAFVGPRLPGAGAEAVYDTRGRGGGVTEVLSPLVDIRSRLTSRSNNELFRVDAGGRSAYWRQTTLPEFDGRRFGLPSRDLERIDADEVFDPTDGEQIRQQIQVIGLGGQLVPAAADPFQASGESLDGRHLELRLNRDTHTLLTPDELGTGDLFTIVSAAPTLTPDVLRTAGSANPPDPMFLGLPDDFPGDIAETARAITGGATTSYDIALALQNWFRSEFAYSTEVQAGHSVDAIEAFLRIRVGYCEQFAVTFAAMARTLGVPTRVAVGFTPGVLGNDGWYTVRGRNAHAWPEVWFDGIGWVPFEPTPGRGAPGTESYTGVPEAQDEAAGVPGGGDGPGGEAVPRPTTPATLVPAGVPGDEAPTTTARPRPGNGPTDPDAQPRPNGGTTSGPQAPPDRGVPLWLYVTTIVVVVGAAAPALARRVRRNRHQGTVEQIVDAWVRARAAAAGAGVPGTPAMTARQWAAATATVLPVAARPMASLAQAVDLVTFAHPDTFDVDHAGTFGETLGDDCELWSQQVERIADDLLPWQKKLVRYFTNWN